MDNGLCFSAADHLVAVVAHPDDESFGCGSLLALAAAAGARVTVVCATCGEAGEPSARADLAGRSLGEVREAELRRAARLLGAERVVMLGYADSGFAGERPRGSLCAAPLADVAHRLTTVLAALRPTVLLTLDGSDGHRDHIHVRDALLAARPVCPVYLSTIPNRLMRRWLDEKLRGGESSAYHAIDPDTIGSADALSSPVDTSSVLALRLKAIAAHSSQRSPFDGLSDELREAFLATDHVIRAA